MKKKSLIYILAIVAIMVLLASILCLFESNNPDASIHNIFDALWYTVVTLTTVGYGDYYPVTAAGKVVGIIIVFCSLGVIANIIATIMNFLNGDVIPGLYLKKNNKKVWYVFSELNDKTKCLMDSIRQNVDMDNAIIICLSEKKWNFSWEQIVEFKKENPDTLHLFFMNDVDNDYINFSNAYSLYKDKVVDNTIPFHVYCLTEYKPEKIHVNLTCFNSYENTARLYWTCNRVQRADEKIVIIGKGKYSQAILQFALQGNVISDKQKVSYHLFMDEKDFIMRHYCLDNFFSVGTLSQKTDSVVFYDSDWHEERELVGTADRIIICDDDETINLSAVSDIRKFYLLNENVKMHVLSFSQFEDISAFGSDEEIYTVDLVIRETLNQVAVSMHNQYCASSSKPQLSWNELSEFLRQSNLAVADHLKYKLDILGAKSIKEAFDKFIGLDELDKVALRKIEHDRWMRFHIVNNWKYNKTRNNALHLHNLIVPFDELSYEEQVKDDYAWEILKDIELK